MNQTKWRTFRNATWRLIHSRYAPAGIAAVFTLSVALLMISGVKQQPDTTMEQTAEAAQAAQADSAQMVAPTEQSGVALRKSQQDYGVAVYQVVGEKAESATETFPDKSFTVEIPTSEGSTITPVKAAHQEYPTRDISGETYTIRNIDTGAQVTGDAFTLVCRIVSGEVGATWETEALKAQAVAAYTYMVYWSNYGVIPSFGIQNSYDSKIENAVRAVEGQLLCYNGKIMDAVFSASSTGATADGSYVWGGSYPYLQSVESKYDCDDANYGIVTKLSATKVKQIIESKTDLTLPADPEDWFTITSSYNGKYIGGVKIAGKSACVVDGVYRTLNGFVMRTNLFGLDVLKSSAFTISYKNGVFTFTTYGYGHGVGMSQWGANLYAKNDGYCYDQILKHYYTGAEIRCITPDGAAYEEKIDGEQPEKTVQTQETAKQDEPVVTTTITQTAQPKETTIPEESTDLVQATTTTPATTDGTDTQTTVDSTGEPSTTEQETEPTQVTEPATTQISAEITTAQESE